MPLTQLPILKRLIPSLRKRISRHSSWPGGNGVVRRNGALFLVNMRNAFDRVLVTHGGFEREQITYFLNNIRDRGCEVFLDIGANVGAYSIFVAQQTSCKTIIAFEPDSRSFIRLRANALLNGLVEVIDARQVAVTDKNGSVPFAYGPDDYDVVSKVSDEPQPQSVPAIRLDDAVSFTGRRIAMKIDIEGHERVALGGMRKLLQNNQCFMQVECFEPNFLAFKSDIEAIGYKYVHQFGYDRYFSNA
jgi:FkbM family methyltransferase